VFSSSGAAFPTWDTLLLCSYDASASGMCRLLILRLCRNEEGWIDNSITGGSLKLFSIDIF